MKVPFFQQAGARGSLFTQDDITVNGYPEKTPDGRIALRKRKGTVRVNQPPAGVATPRGIAAFNGQVISVFGGNVYYGTTLIGPANIGTDQITDKAFGASWTATSCTEAAASEGPLTDTSAYRIYNAAASEGKQVHSAIAVAAGETIFLSVWVKDNEGHANDEGQVLRVKIALTGGTAKDYEAKFLPNSLTGPSTYEIAATAANGDCQIKESYGGTWYQCMLKMTTGDNTSAAITIWPGAGTVLEDADDFDADEGNEFYNPVFYRSVTNGTGVFSFVECGTETRQLAFGDGDDLWIMGTDYVMWPNLETAADIVPSISYLDGYLTKMDATGQIDHSEPLTPYDWPPENTTNAESWADDGRYLCRHNNYLLAIGASSMEFFYNAANTEGSAFSRVDGAMQRIGAAHKRVCAELRGTVAFFSYPSAIYMVAETKPKRISTPAVERLLAAATLTDAWVYGHEMDGHSFYTFIFPTSNISLCYDASTESWHQLKDTGGNYFKIINAVELLGVIYGQHLTDGYVYKFSGAQDNGTSFAVVGRSGYGDLGMSERKRCRALTLQGDLQTGETISLRYSDDDFGNWSTARSVTVLPRTKTFRLGQFTRRAWEFSYTGAYELRLFDVDLDVGK